MIGFGSSISAVSRPSRIFQRQGAAYNLPLINCNVISLWKTQQQQKDAAVKNIVLTHTSILTMVLFVTITTTTTTSITLLLSIYIYIQPRSKRLYTRCL